MSALTVAAVAAPFGRDLDEGLARAATLVDAARARGAALVVLPEATLGGYLADLDGADGFGDLPPALDPQGPEVARLAAIAGDTVVCAGFCEAGEDGRRYNAAVCVSGDGLLGRHRKVHQPLGEGGAYGRGEAFEAFDTPVGRLGMVICYDKAFPEAARTLALDGAEVVCCLSAWPAARTNPAPDLAQDRWTRRFDLFDEARALENQLLWVSSNQTGTFGELRFVGRAKVVGPGGEVLAETGVDGGLAVASLDLRAALEVARRGMSHLADRQVASYRLDRGPVGSVPAGTP